VRTDSEFTAKAFDSLAHARDTHPWPVQVVGTPFALILNLHPDLLEIGTDSDRNGFASGMPVNIGQRLL
jgi:hypothetical protein